MRSCALRLAMRRQLVRAAKAIKLLQLDSALDLSFKSVEDVLAKRSKSSSFQKGKSLRMALGRSTEASFSKVMLQAQLMNGRQNKAASLGVNAVNVSESPMPPSARACNAEEATGWGGRASCVATAVSGNQLASRATSGGQRALTQEDRLDKLTEIAAQQASAINRMSQELTSLASGFGELMHLVDTKSASLKA
eukprot:jgi/Chrpa1/21684/Chrysochromulina_OHIO_Genome00025939-RA